MDNNQKFTENVSSNKTSSKHKYKISNLILKQNEKSWPN